MSNQPEDEEHKLPAAVERVEQQIELLPPQQQQQVMQILMQKGTSFTGPIPPPDMLIEYQRVMPDLPGRLVTAWEEESAHRRKMERDSLDGQISIAKNSQLYAFVLVILLAIAAFVLAFTGHEWVAGIVFATTILSVLCVYVLGEQPKKKAGEEPEEPEAPKRPTPPKKPSNKTKKQRRG